MTNYRKICNALNKLNKNCSEEKMMEKAYNVMREEIGNDKNRLLMFKAQSRKIDYNYIFNLISFIAFYLSVFVIIYPEEGNPLVIIMAILLLLTILQSVKTFDSVKVWGKYLEVAIEEIEKDFDH